MTLQESNPSYLTNLVALPSVQLLFAMHQLFSRTLTMEREVGTANWPGDLELPSALTPMPHYLRAGEADWEG